ncbi:hypothetical protein [Knoellia sp. LjRoot47]|uniref:hypothetical protein n=1 Tax=Knoellia sp. LjRoot47 TaxID=3342330 RepID=UPI003ECECFF5
MSAQVPQSPQVPRVPSGPAGSPVPHSVAPGTPRTQSASGWALGLSAAALAVSLTVAGFLVLQMFFGFALAPFGWFAYAPGSTEIEMGEPIPMLNEASVVVDPSGGVTGEAVAAALSGSLDPDGGRLRCRDVRPVVADATSVCTHEGLPEERVVVLFLDGSGRFVWTQVPIGSNSYLPRD